MDLSGFEVWIIIGLVVGIIASNLAVLKYSAKFKMPHLGSHKDKSIVSGDDAKATDEQRQVNSKDNPSSKTD
ncbi:DUF2897 family protein [Shewanella subflava]|uniref:DUF2897 family protein n=1 Tax=Shewanella subflava TaxID=2986476 RepID=A0ABT3I7D0_9GAMM|nr:DUF2897 family protein [Shewanella subflava]MCW3171962.1 DUF2897 family protein [Shewanella subflava]